MKIVLALAASVLLAGQAVVSGQAFAAEPKPIEQYDYWGAFEYQDPKRGKLCYALAVPQAKAPADRNHGDVFFVVSAKPGGYEPQVEVGYPFKTDADVRVKVGKRSFDMFSKDNNAWLKDLKGEPALIEAMRKGAQMTVSGTSQKGTRTSYTYNLKGVTAALKRIRSCG